MELLEKYRNKDTADEIVASINQITPEGPVKVMHVCGTHEFTIVRHGLRSLLPENIELIAGPGCPVCVTPAREIDEAVKLAGQEVLITTFGDMFHVPGSNASLEGVKTDGADVKIVYGVSDAVEIARENPDREVVHVAIGFETTAPTTAAEILSEPPKNFSILSCHRLIPPAMEFLLNSGESEIDGFLCPGHVSTIIGSKPYEPISKEFGVPQVVAGFEPLDVLLGVLMLLRQIRDARGEVENEYTRAVKLEGNKLAQEKMREVFKITSENWRGFPTIPDSALELRDEFQQYDARERFDIEIEETQEFAEGCRCGEVLRGLINPSDCPLFLKACTPDSPKGPCMVSFEGTCSVWAKHGGK
ncbi:hydrogenase assembly protein HupF [candidate division MSBL1 archaeon SCGC-AAA261O19]|uniref:Hydrogenase assembly protein HupF n=1 Tax=candidate division MSBL1 archaeon SCGC-AAA261O19 TaxID=1698277 RepID=A0A133VDR6_9EURY|nr:hydrogenase assembly protein HupF [candidate division MSBL1 archaeon SCGC-AAA261O19]